VDTLRDLARFDPWRESLERSLARRGKELRAAARLDELRRRDEDTRGGEKQSEDTPDAEDVRATERRVKLRRSPSIATAWMTLLAVVAGVFTLALLAVTHPSVSDGEGVAKSAHPGRGSAHGGAPATAMSRSNAARSMPPITPGPGGAGCALLSIPAGYANPLAHATVKPERIDQGVDYAGSGTLSAIGTGTITYLATSDAGWPGTFIEFQLTGGADAGCYVYYAEGVNPIPGLRVGQSISAGQPIATIIPDWPTGIEIGWGAGTGTKAFAGQKGEWDDTHDQYNIPTSEGKSFSALIAALGGPPGKLEGQ
jgi:hypothetical protein